MVPEHAGAAPAQIEVWVQKLAGGVRLSSVWPLQSSSLPLQLSVVVGLTGQVYSQPLGSMLSRLAKPGRQVTMVQLPAEQPATALVKVQTRPQVPQLRGSVWRL